MKINYFAGDTRSNRERMLAGDWYIADDPESQRIAKRGERMAVVYHQAWLADEAAAAQMLHSFLGSVGEGTVIKPPFVIDFGDNLYIGAGTFINFNLTALDVAEIRIGEGCMLGPNVQLYTAIHPVPPVPRADLLEAGAPITLGRNVWVGGGAIILPGVSIGENSVIGAGAVVTGDIPANCVAVGNPARVIREGIDRVEFHV